MEIHLCNLHSYPLCSCKIGNLHTDSSYMRFSTWHMICKAKIILPFFCETLLTRTGRKNKKKKIWGKLSITEHYLPGHCWVTSIKQLRPTLVVSKGAIRVTTLVSCGCSLSFTLISKIIEFIFTPTELWICWSADNLLSKLCLNKQHSPAFYCPRCWFASEKKFISSKWQNEGNGVHVISSIVLQCHLYL